MRLILSAIFAFGLSVLATAQAPTPQPPATLGLEQGVQEFATPAFKLKLVKASQTVAALEPVGSSGFDFTPADRLTIRSADGFYHLGDLKFTVRIANGEWREFSTAAAR